MPGGRLRWACLGLKLVGLAALAACLLEPLWTGLRARPGANLFAVVADNSRSLQVRDAGDARTRGEGLRELLDPGRSAWPGKLAEGFDVRRYAFDARIQNVRDFAELDFTGRSSAIGAALRGLAERSKGRPLAGILLFTDGNATDIRGALPELAGVPPVYPVVLGRRDAVKDISLRQVTVSQTVFEDAPVTVQADVISAGFGGEKVLARLRDRTGKLMGEQTVRGRADGEGAALRFNHANSLLRAGDLGEAIAEYRAAALRAPNDTRIQTNLSEARGQVARSPGVATPTILQRICGVWDFATEQVRWIATIALLWIGCAVLTLNTHWRSYGLTAFACALLLGTTVMLDVARRNSSAAAVFIDLAVIRKGNGEGFELTIAQPLPEGTECEVIESRLGWIQVELADGTRGWVDDQAIIRVN